MAARKENRLRKLNCEVLVFRELDNKFAKTAPFFAGPSLSLEPDSLRVGKVSGELQREIRLMFYNRTVIVNGIPLNFRVDTMYS